MQHTYTGARGWEMGKADRESKLFFFFKESLIAFILCRIWRWTAAPGKPVGLSLPHGPVPAPPILYTFTR